MLELVPSIWSAALVLPLPALSPFLWVTDALTI